MNICRLKALQQSGESEWKKRAETQKVDDMEVCASPDVVRLRQKSSTFLDWFVVQ